MLCRKDNNCFMAVGLYQPVIPIYTRNIRRNFIVAARNKVIVQSRVGVTLLTGSQIYVGNLPGKMLPFKWMH